MKIIEAIETLTRIYTLSGSRRDSMKLAVSVHQPGSIGVPPHVDVTSFHPGFDWSAGLVLIGVEPQVTKLTEEEKADIAKSLKLGQSWHNESAYAVLYRKKVMLEQQLELIRIAVENLLTEEQLDAPIPALNGRTARSLFPPKG